MGRGSSKIGGSGGGVLSGQGNNELTDSIDLDVLPQATRDRLPEIKNIRSYSDAKAWLAAEGIELDTDLDALKNTRSNDDIPAVTEQVQKIATAVSAYKETFGDDALSNLSKIVLYSDATDASASYFFNRVGENDPLAGQLHFSQWGNSNYQIFHELAHAYQDSHKAKGEDAVSYSQRMVKSAKLPDSFSAYTGAKNDVIDAERFADAFGKGFANGNKTGIDFIKNVRKKRR